MKDAGFAHMGVGVAKGAGKAENAAKAAISSPLLETSIAGARGVIINITSSPGHRPRRRRDRRLDDHPERAPRCDIIWGTAFDDHLADEMNITVVATGFENTPGVDEPIQAAMNAQAAAKEQQAAAPSPRAQRGPGPCGGARHPQPRVQPGLQHRHRRPGGLPQTGRTGGGR